MTHQLKVARFQMKKAKTFKLKLAVSHHKPAAKLDVRKVNLIRKDFWVNKISQTALARKYGTHQSNVSAIVNFKSWI